MLIIGPPGSGKGTQAERISERLGVVAISTGDIFRANVKGGTPLGVEARKYMDNGDFVPDSVTNEMVRDRLSQDDATEGFLLDGYPRTVAQVEYLDGILAASSQALSVVLQLTADDEELVTRLLGRARETGRSDDNEGVIRHRLDLYHQQTEAVVAKYAERGILTRVDGIGGIEEVTDRVLGSIDDVLSVPVRGLENSNEGMTTAVPPPSSSRLFDPAKPVSRSLRARGP
jgi:adenylate kinase